MLALIKFGAWWSDGVVCVATVLHTPHHQCHDLNMHIAVRLHDCRNPIDILIGDSPSAESIGDSPSCANDIFQSEHLCCVEVACTIEVSRCLH